MLILDDSMIYSIHHALSLSKYRLCMGDRGFYAFMVSKQQKERSDMDISLFLVSLSANVGLHAAPDPFPRKPFPFRQ